MLAHNGTQLGASCIHGVQSVAARSFYSAFGRWSSVGCAARGRAYHGTSNGHKDRSLRRPGRLQIRKEAAIGLQGQRRLESGIGSSLNSGVRDGPEKLAKETETEGARKHDPHLDSIKNDRDPDEILEEDTGTTSDSLPEGEKSSWVDFTPTVYDFPDAEYPDPPPNPNPRVAFAAATAEDATKDLPTSMRRLMRIVPHPVTVITTTTRQIHEKPEENEDLPIQDFRGMTISSFNTVTLDPVPIITFNIRNPSSTLDAIKHNGFFLLHLLTQSPHGRSIAETFAKGNGVGEIHEEIFRTPAGECVLIGAPFFKQVGGFLPKINYFGGVNRALRCEILSREDRAALGGGGDGFIQVGDHTIVLAKVHAIQPPFKDSDYHEDARNLAYAHGKYVGMKTLDVLMKLNQKNAEKKRRRKERATEQYAARVKALGDTAEAQTEDR